MLPDASHSTATRGCSLRFASSTRSGRRKVIATASAMTMRRKCSAIIPRVFPSRFMERKKNHTEAIRNAPATPSAQGALLICQPSITP